MDGGKEGRGDSLVAAEPAADPQLPFVHGSSHEGAGGRSGADN